MKINVDCVHYRGFRPCAPNKLRGAICPQCRDYRAKTATLLIIKLGAAGDVLRTTFLLPALKRTAGPGAHICWLTDAAHLPILDNNPFINETLDAGHPATLARLLSAKWDAVYCLDNTPEAGAFCAASNSIRKYGFSLSERGMLKALDGNAGYWLELACFDQLKK
ncbi:MAG TPA: hypothetical protein PLL10_04550, partial [Elusimicrobiales bacterium]|nr:hypothetical protein [Elusimicrobiales bacterium]